MALEGLKYQFGAEDPSTGGLDCSGAVQYLLGEEGIRGVPRTAYEQYQWLKKAGTLNRVSRWSWSKRRVATKLRPGDLMFWTGTYDTGRSPNISHVMIYLGQDARDGRHYMFGASSRRSKGVHGHAVDVYEFVYPRKHGKDNFAGFGSVPGLAQ
jgi:cell wall-associated NlpC family hydrolase